MYQFFVCALVLLVVWLFGRWRRMRQYWPQRGVPQRPPHPVLGSLTFLQRKNPGLWMRDLYNEFKTPYVGIWVFWRPGLVINCPEIGRKVLIKDADNFKNRFLSSGKSDPIGGLNLFTVNDPLWTFIRKRLTSVFTGAKLRALHDLYHTKATELVQRIAVDTKQGITIDLRSTFSDYTTDVIGQASFGVISNATLTGASALRSVTKEFMKYSAWRGFAWSSIFFFPELVDVFGFSFFPKDTVDYFKRVFRMVVSERGGYDKINVEGRDLLDALVKMKQDAAKENEVLSEDLLIAQAAVFLQAGYDTSSLALAYTIYELAFHPQCQEKLYEELSAAKQDLETLRKYPIMGWLDRIAAQDYKIDDNLTIEAGTVVYVNAIGMQMDPEYYPEPELFNPDRFLPENETNIQSFTFMPFGEGPRHCIGKRFGLNTVRYALALIIINYQVQVIPNTPKPNDCGVEKRGLFLMPDDPLCVKFVPRLS